MSVRSVLREVLGLSPAPRYESLVALDRMAEPPPPVFVVGMHNSGTSILAEILEEAGYFFGSDINHTESSYFSLFLNDTVLLGGNDAWANLPLPPIERIRDVSPATTSLIRHGWLPDYLRLGYRMGSPWGVKDPRMCVLLPLYLDVWPEATIVEIRRDPADVASSLTLRPKTGLGLQTDDAFWLDLHAAYAERVSTYAPQFAAHHVLSYEEMCSTPHSVLGALFEVLETGVDVRTLSSIAKLSTGRIGSGGSQKAGRVSAARTQIQRTMRHKAAEWLRD